MYGLSLAIIIIQIVVKCEEEGFYSDNKKYEELYLSRSILTFELYF